MTSKGRPTEDDTQESAIRQSAQAWLAYRGAVHQVEEEAYRAVMEANRKHLDQLGQRHILSTMNAVSQAG